LFWVTLGFDLRITCLEKRMLVWVSKRCKVTSYLTYSCYRNWTFNWTKPTDRFWIETNKGKNFAGFDLGFLGSTEMIQSARLWICCDRKERASVLKPTW
jgi:hypothetical protein